MPINEPRFALRSALVAGLLLLAAGLAACGQKGPLYMPPPATPDARLTTPPGTPAPDTASSKTQTPAPARQ